MNIKQNIVILGATATGKTRLAVALAYKINGEIISADSRQVYRHMNIGTGKDLNEYFVNGRLVPYHLIDIAEPGEEYNIFRYKKDFEISYQKIISNDRTPIICGGSGLYIETAIGLNNLVDVPFNMELRAQLTHTSLEELINMLQNYKILHNNTDSTDRERCIRALEIALFKEQNSETNRVANLVNETIFFGIKLPREIIRSNITKRLAERIEDGMIQEVETLIKLGISVEKLKFYGLEYKWIAQYLNNEITKNVMIENLNIAIHQFAKRQETWWRRMEKNGIKIHWIDGLLPLNEKLNLIERKLMAY